MFYLDREYKSRAAGVEGVVDIADIINSRVQNYHEALKIIQGALAMEMEKKFSERRLSYIIFLSREKSVYEFCITEMDYVLKAITEASK